jgi:hypothetical protein
VVDNTLARRFDVDAPDRAWVTDITYIRTQEGFAYLAVVIDLFSRHVIGWSLQSRQTTVVVLQALLMALFALPFPFPWAFAMSAKMRKLAAAAIPATTAPSSCAIAVRREILMPQSSSSQQASLTVCNDPKPFGQCVV